ncbi:MULTISPECIES: sugar ABC transporter permease [Kitasatospora]|uniref:Putative L-arabinose ABC transporter permease protein n=1 Tax=Kitasatospora setae (strain ATCC 33774 / DSM 43861 / JCM 3304 / KCC A-0304 / NBRC 14216 / KM-6054) TaxID=452652 RepID=E4N5I5_KITSK|nr:MULTISPECIES: sugar ABC transporter permease [Kitasatospora]BAJ26466.1 putative L-arabinose ABC transporter permease protein [Kitasatospora setae KM-6054]
MSSPGTTTARRPGTATARRRPGSGARRAAPYLFVLPALALFAVFKLYPIARSFVLSLHKTVDGQDTFVGADNYTRLLHDPLFWTALKNTATVLVVQVPLMLALATGLAVALDSRLLRARAVFRLGFFLPMVTGLVAYGVIFSVLLNEKYGLVNWLLQFAGIDAVPWLTDPLWAKLSLALALTWHYTGYNAVILLARLQTIPTELYDAAAVDGAGGWTSFRHVTLPGLRPALLLTTVLSTIGTLQIFDEPYVLTRGGPDNATLTIGMYLYQNAFSYFDFGYASAIAYALAVLIGLLGLVQFKVLGDRDGDKSGHKPGHKPGGKR